MISRTTLCSAQASVTRFARTRTMPVTSRSRSGSASMTSNTFSPNARTSLRAQTAPIPRIMPQPRYFSMPSTEDGSEVRMQCAPNCWPWVPSLTHSPEAVIHSPGATWSAARRSRSRDCGR